MLRPFMEGLAEKLRAGPPDMNPMLFATALNDRCNTAIALQLVGGTITVTLRAESSNQARRQGGAGTGQRFEYVEVGMSAGEFVDLVIVGSDRVSELFQNPHESERGRRGGHDHGPVTGRRDCTLNLVDSVLDLFAMSAIVVDEEPFQCLRLRPLKLLQCRPALEETSRDL